MARNRGRKPSDASQSSPDSRPASPGRDATAADLGSANGSVGVGPTGQRATPPGGAPAASTPTAGMAPPDKEAASAAGGQPPRSGPGSPPPGAASGRPGGPPPSGGAGSSGRPPSGAGGGSAAGRTPGGTAPPAGGHRSLRNGLIGGVIGGALAALAMVYFMPQDDAELQALRSQVEQLEGSVAGVAGGEDAMAELSSRIATLEQAAPPGISAELQAQLDALQQTPPAALEEELQARLEGLEQGGPDIAGLAERVDALESSLSSGPAQGDLDQRLSALQEELAALSANVAAQALGEGDPATADLALLETLQSRLGALEQSQPGAGGEEAIAELEARLTEVESSLPDAGIAADVALRLDALSARVDALQSLAGQAADTQEALAGLSSQLRGLEEQIQGLRERADATRAAADALTARLDQTEADVAAVQDRRQRAAVLALIASQIDAAVSQSRPYEAPLQSLQALDGEDTVVSEVAAALEPMASAGVPSLAALRRSFEDVAGEIVHRARAPEGDSLLDQAAGNLMRLVSVRPVGGEVEGDGAAARAARAEARLAEGDLAAAVAELEGLEGAPAEAAADWLAAARSRLAVADALSRLQSRTTELLSQSG